MKMQNNILSHIALVKPIKPTEPNPLDLKKYPKEFNNGKIIDSPFILDYKKYQKTLEQYEIDFELYTQTKFIQDIKRSNIKLCLKKYKIVKIK